MLARHTQVALLLLLSYVILQASSQRGQVPKVYEVCVNKTINNKASNTLNLLTKLLWGSDDEWIPKEGSELSITFYLHPKLNLISFLKNIKNHKEDSWIITIREIIRMKITLSIRDTTDIHRQYVYWRYRSASKQNTNVWDKSCVLSFEDCYNRIPASSNHVNISSAKKEIKTSNKLSNKSLLNIIKRDVVNMHSAADLRNLSVIGLSLEDYITTQIRLIARHFISDLANGTFLLNNLVSNTLYRINHDMAVTHRTFTINFLEYLLEEFLNLFYSEDDDSHDSQDNHKPQDPAKPRTIVNTKINRNSSQQKINKTVSPKDEHNPQDRPHQKPQKINDKLDEHVPQDNLSPEPQIINKKSHVTFPNHNPHDRIYLELQSNDTEDNLPQPRIINTKVNMLFPRDKHDSNKSNREPRAFKIEKFDTTTKRSTRIQRNPITRQK